MPDIPTLFLSLLLSRFEALIDGFETRADDVFVCTFVKVRCSAVQGCTAQYRAQCSAVQSE
jgi:hypothetical protein